MQPDKVKFDICSGELEVMQEKKDGLEETEANYVHPVNLNPNEDIVDPAELKMALFDAKVAYSMDINKANTVIKTLSATLIVIISLLVSGAIYLSFMPGKVMVGDVCLSCWGNKK